MSLWQTGSHLQGWDLHWDLGLSHCTQRVCTLGPLTWHCAEAALAVCCPSHWIGKEFSRCLSFRAPVLASEEHFGLFFGQLGPEA